MDDPGEVVVWLFIFALMTALASVVCVLTRHWQRAAETRQLQLQQHQQHQHQQSRETAAYQRRQHHLALLRHLEQESAALLSAIGLPRFGAGASQEATHEETIESWCPAKPYAKVLEALDEGETHPEETGGNTDGASSAAASQQQRQQLQQDGQEQEQQQPAAAAAAAAGPSEQVVVSVASETEASCSRQNGSSSKETGETPQCAQLELPSHAVAAENSNASCSICFEMFLASAAVRLLPCKHIYHKRCIDTWFERSPLCPLCMRDYAEELGAPADGGPQQSVGSHLIADASAALALLAFLGNQQTRRSSEADEV